MLIGIDRYERAQCLISSSQRLLAEVEVILVPRFFFIY